MSRDQPCRRHFLARCAVAAAPPLLGPRLLSAFEPGMDAFAPGQRLGLVPFDDQRGKRFGVARGRGHNGRLHVDLSRLTPDTLVVANDDFYIRTRRPDRIGDDAPWSVRVRGAVEPHADIDARRLDAAARPMGVHLLECSGNGGSFGLMSAAEWSGVPLSEFLATLSVRANATRVLVAGFDEHSSTKRGSPEAGASWIFRFRDIERTGAFLATRMNGERLPADHGFPVRLVVPGWYGCTCIKWVDTIRLVDDTAVSTPHMREFASRTHQDGTPRYARDFAPASIDVAAMPIRVERWRVGGRTVYRVVGLIWGGSRTTDALAIRFGRSASYVPVESLSRTTTKTWSIWTHTWKPRKSGRYRIQLRATDPSIRTRRLDRGFYARTVEI